MNSFLVTYTLSGVILFCCQVPVSYTAVITQCSPKLVNCTCGKTGSTVSIPLNQCSVFKESKRSCEICDGQDEATTCVPLINCHTCSADPTGGCASCPQARGGSLCDIVLGCHTLMPPVNGKVQPPNKSPFDFKEGEVVTYSCNNGFTLTAGSITRECSKDGTWSGVEPICVENSNITFSTAPTKSQSCPIPETPENGSIDVQLDSVIYECNPNFNLQGDETRQCINGVWTGSSPSCVQKENTQCPAIKPISGAKVIITQNYFSSIFFRSQEVDANKHLGPFTHGIQLDYTCDFKFYKLTGSSKIRCTNGIWSANPPICSPICGRSSKAPIRQNANGMTRANANADASATATAHGSASASAKASAKASAVAIASSSESDSTSARASVGQWPWTIAIKIKRDASNWDFICEGSLISERMVLTSGHCVTDHDSGVKLPADSFKLYAGKHYTDDSKDDTEVQIRFPFKIFPHPDYNVGNLDSDIAIMQVLPGFQLTNRVQPVCLPIDVTVRTGQNAIVIGWGKTYKRLESAELNYAQLSIFSNEKCKDKYEEKGISVIDNMICAGFDQSGLDTCTAAAGGPLIVSSNSNAPEWSITGVVSRVGYECGDMSVYTKVKNYVDWISDLEIGFSADSFTGITGDIARRPPGICPRPPPSLPHGTIQLLGDKGSDLVTSGATIVYNCNPGFNLRGVAASVCIYNGTWSTPLPECVPEIVKCPAVEPIRAANVTVTKPGKDPSTFLKTKEQSAEKFLGPFEETTQLDYRCESKFYTLIGASSRTCMPNGRWSGSAPVCLQDCGRSSGPRTPFVTHGTASELGQWPWQVAIFFRNRSIDNLIYFCGGSLVNERWVLTAAHCVQSEGSIFPINVIRLYFGKHFQNMTQDDASVENCEPLQIIVHPDYNDVTYDSDIALIKVTAIRFTSRIQPICLPDVTDIDLRLQKGNLGIVTGWGSQEDGNLAPVLKYVQVPVVPVQQCRDAYSKLEVGVSIDKNTICAGHEEGQKDACDGDSGGPLVFPINPHIKDKWVIEGIVSWGSPFACGNKEQYSGYTRVQNFVPWIKYLIEH